MLKRCTAELHIETVASVEQLQAECGPFDGIVVAAGAAAGTLPEIGIAAKLAAHIETLM